MLGFSTIDDDARNPIGGLTILPGTSVGALLTELLVGHLCTRHARLGRIPDGAVTLMTSLGLAAFVAMTGLHAGPIFFSALAEAGIGLMFGGMVVTLTPLLTSLAFGHFVLRMNPVLLLGYTPAVPLAHILLTTWGTVIVGVIAKG